MPRFKTQNHKWRKSFIWFRQSMTYHFKSSENTSVFSQLFSQLPGIHTEHTRDVVLFEPIWKRLLSCPMRMLPRITGNDETWNVNFFALKVLWKAVIIHQGLIGNTIISNQWISKHEDLTSITWIRQGFGVTDHSSVENNFTRHGSGCSKGLGFDDGAIGQIQQGLFTLIVFMNQDQKQSHISNGWVCFVSMWEN